MDFDIAKLSPSMSQARLQDNHSAAILKLAKKTMEQNGEMLTELLDAAAPAEVSSSAIDIKL